MNTCLHACMHACMHAYIHTYLHTYIHTYVHTYEICSFQKIGVTIMQKPIGHLRLCVGTGPPSQEIPSSKPVKLWRRDPYKSFIVVEKCKVKTVAHMFPQFSSKKGGWGMDSWKMDCLLIEFICLIWCYIYICFISFLPDISGLSDLVSRDMFPFKRLVESPKAIPAEEGDLSSERSTVRRGPDRTAAYEKIGPSRSLLGGGFKYFWISLLLGEMIQFD